MKKALQERGLEIAEILPMSNDRAAVNAQQAQQAQQQQQDILAISAAFGVPGASMGSSAFAPVGLAGQFMGFANPQHQQNTASLLPLGSQGVNNQVSLGFRV